MRSYNGWSASTDADALGIVAFEPIPGHPFPAGVKVGDVHTVFTYLVRQLDARVEAIELYVDGDEWGYSYRANRNNPDTLSCHASGTAVDYNATRHPNGRRGTFTSWQMTEIDRILAELDGVVHWGGDFTGTPDEMHFEIAGTAAEVAAVAKRLTTPIPPSEDDDMTPAQAAQLKAAVDGIARLEAAFAALVAPRRADKADRDPKVLDLGDVVTKVERETP